MIGTEMIARTPRAALANHSSNAQNGMTMSEIIFSGITASISEIH